MENKKLRRPKRPDGFWKNMSDWNLIHYVRSQHYGDTLTQFSKSRDLTGYQECILRKIKTEDRREISLLDFLVEEGTLIRKKQRNYYWIDKSNEDLMHYVRSRHYGQAVSDLALSGDLEVYKECRTRKIKAEDGREIDLLDFFVDEGTLIRTNQWEEKSNEDLIHHIRSQHYGDALTEFGASNGSLYQICSERNVRAEDGREIKLLDFLVNEGTLIRLQRTRDYWKEWQNLSQELKRIAQELGHFPGHDELKRINQNSVSYAINKYHGGMKTVKERMGIISDNQSQDYSGREK